MFPMQPFKWQADGTDNTYAGTSHCVWHFCDVDPREEAFEGQELRYLAALRLPFRYTQHVQGIP